MWNAQGALGLGITGAGYMAMILQFGRYHHTHLNMREYTLLNEKKKLLSFVGLASDRICMHGDAILEFSGAAGAAVSVFGFRPLFYRLHRR